jgi:membrane associated rhomboid family serine protease
VISVASVRSAAVLHHYERTPAVLHGQWWRTITALFTQDGGWGGAADNLAFLLILGVVAEQVTGRFSWLFAYFATGVTGEFFGYAWQPTGGGNSVAVCGLAGLIAIGALRRDPRMPRHGVFLLVLWCGAMLATWNWLAVIPAWLLAVLVLRLGLIRWRGLGVIAVMTVLASGGVLAAVRNIHGAALLASLVFAAVVWWWGARRRPGRPPLPARQALAADRTDRDGVGERPQVRLGELDIGGRRVHLHMGHAAGARDRNDVGALCEQPGEHQPAQADLVSGSDLLGPADQGDIGVDVLRREPGVITPVVTLAELLCGSQLAGQQAAAKRAAGDEPDTSGARGRQDFRLDAALKKRVFAGERRDGVHSDGPGQLLGARF